MAIARRVQTVHGRRFRGGRRHVKCACAIQEKTLRLAAAAVAIPHPAKAETGGEDAWFVAEAFHGAVGVADGVSGWAEDGVDPGDYARMFMDACKQLLEQSAIDDAVQSNKDTDESEDLEDRRKRLRRERKKLLDPVGLLAHGQARTRVLGAATACVALLDHDTLRVAHVGDSGARVLRKGEFVGSTTVQQHMFNCPFQLSHEELVETTDTAEDDAEYIEWNLEEGDTVVVASDGLFDNVFDEDIAKIVAEVERRVAEEAVLLGEGKHEGLEMGRNLSKSVAEALVGAAVQKSQDMEYISPFVTEALNQGMEGQLLSPWERILGKKLTGGKVDDITVVVAKVVESRIMKDFSMEHEAHTSVETMQ
eukprot:scaffold1771_cov343-Pavlova_lutheri.AAC.23